LVRTSQRVQQVVGCVLLLVCGGIGLWNVVQEWGQGATFWQRSVTVAVGIYAVLGVVGGAALAFRKRWSLPFAIGWALASVYAAGTSVMSYGGGDLVSVLSAFLGAGAVCGLVVWCTDRATRVDRTP
jgi:hypothetical protein